MTLPSGFSINIDVPWVDVNVTWDACPWHDPEFIALQDQAFAAKVAAEAAWAVEFPQLAAALDPAAILNPITRERVLDYLGPWAIPPSDLGPWAGPPPDAPLDAWLLDAALTVNSDAGINADLQTQAHAVLRHRFAFETRRRAVQPALLPKFEALRVWSADHTAKQFCNHAANKPGVLIEVAARNDRPRRTLLLGDVVSSGAWGGCCTDGLDAEDVILRYRDLREFIDAAREA